MTLLAAEDAGLLLPARTPGGHRRYDVLDLDRLLVRRRPAPPDPAPSSAEADREQPDPVIAEALRQLVLLLRADSAALYEVEGGALTLRRSFGMPRWLIDQLAPRPAPEPVLQALATAREVRFDGDGCFPRPSSGPGVAAPVLHGEQPLGVLTVLSGRGRVFLGGELDIIRATATCLSLMLEQQRLVVALSARLREVHRLSTTTKETIHA